MMVSGRTLFKAARELQVAGIPIKAGELRDVLFRQGWIAKNPYANRTPHTATPYAEKHGYMVKDDASHHSTPYVTDHGLEVLKSKLTRVPASR